MRLTLHLRAMKGTVPKDCGMKVEPRATCIRESAKLTSDVTSPIALHWQGKVLAKVSLLHTELPLPYLEPFSGPGNGSRRNLKPRAMRDCLSWI